MPIVNMNFLRSPEPSRANQFLSWLSRWGLRLTWLTYAAALFWLTHTPVPEAVSSVTSQWDKVLHFGAYLGLALLTVAVCLNSFPSQISALFLGATLMVYAALDEFLQGYVGRQPDVMDWICDCLGIIVGFALWQAVMWGLNSRSGWMFSFRTHHASEANGLAR